MYFVLYVLRQALIVYGLINLFLGVIIWVRLPQKQWMAALGWICEPMYALGRRILTALFPGRAFKRDMTPAAAAALPLCAALILSAFIR